ANLAGALVLEELVDIEISLRKLVAFRHLVACLYEENGTAGDTDLLGLRLLIFRDEANGLEGALLFDLIHLAVERRKDGAALRGAGLEDFFDARKTVRDVRTGDASGVEGTHRKLGARLTDGLGGDDADRGAHLDRLVIAQVVAIALGTD